MHQPIQPHITVRHDANITLWISPMMTMEGHNETTDTTTEDARTDNKRRRLSAKTPPQAQPPAFSMAINDSNGDDDQAAMPTTRPGAGDGQNQQCTNTIPFYKHCVSPK